MAARLSLTVAESSHQIRGSNDNAVTTSNQAMGNLSTNADYVSGRFTGVTVPQGGRINRAVFRISFQSISTSSALNMDVVGHDDDNSGALSAANNYLLGLSVTTAVSVVLMSDLPNGFIEVDVTDIVQEIVDRSGWASGNALTLRALVEDASTQATADQRTLWELEIIYDAQDTGWLNPTAESGSFASPTNAYSNNGGTNATMDNSVSGSHRYSGFDFSQVPTGATILGVEVRVDGWCSSNTNKSQIGVEISKNAGTNYATQKLSSQITTGELSYFFGLGDEWSIGALVVGDLDADVYVRVANSFATSTNDGRYDWVAVRVLYTLPTTGRPTTVLNAPADAATTSDTTPDLDSTATDPESNEVRYNVQLDTLPNFRSTDASGAKTNLVANPSFETLTSGWADNWTRGAGSVYTVDTGGLGQSPNPTNALKITHAGEAQQYCKSAKITVDPAKTYYWSFTLHITAFTSGSIDWNFEEFTSGDVFVANQYKGFKAAVGSWRITGTYTPTNGTVAKMEFQFFNGVGTNTGYVDQVELYEVNSQANGPKVTITMDDGWASQYTNRASFKNRNIHPSIAITSDFIGTGGYMTWAQVEELVNDYGWEAMNHSKTHTDFTTLTEAQLVTEVDTCQDAIVANVGVTPTDIAWPYGSWDTESIYVAARYIRGMRSYTTKGSEGTMAAPYEDTAIWGIKVENTVKVADILSWIDEAIDQSEWLVLVFHELVSSGPTQFQWKVADIEAVMDYINLRQARGDIRYVQFAEGRDLYRKKVPLLDKVSGTDAGFANTTDGADTDPFDDTDLVRHTVQSALSLGTYFWRARAIDPAGANIYGNWATMRSVIIEAAQNFQKSFRRMQAVFRASFF